jgi:hypothetical protein
MLYDEGGWRRWRLLLVPLALLAILLPWAAVAVVVRVLRRMTPGETPMGIDDDYYPPPRKRWPLGLAVAGTTLLLALCVVGLIAFVLHVHY